VDLRLWILLRRWLWTQNNLRPDLLRKEGLQFWHEMRIPWKLNLSPHEDIRRVEVQLHAFLMSPLDGTKFIPEEIAPDIRGPQSRSAGCGEIGLRDINSIPQAFSPWTSHYADWATSNPIRFVHWHSVSDVRYNEMSRWYYNSVISETESVFSWPVAISNL
jgi:hypothetical protein